MRPGDATKNAPLSPRIVSYASLVFADRGEAGDLLAKQLADFREQRPVVLAVPRGGVVIGAHVARKLDAPLDIMLSRKLGSPETPELAIGAIAEDGTVVLNEPLIAELDVPRSYIAEETQRQRNEIRRRAAIFRTVRPKIVLRGKTVIVVDDGAATGATLQAALWACRHENPMTLVCAFPAGSDQAVTRLTDDCDLLLALSVPPLFNAVSQAYASFPQISDERVLDILRAEGR